MIKSLPANVEDTGSISGWGRSPGEGNGSVLAWKILWDGGAWQASVHGVTKSQIRLNV